MRKGIEYHFNTLAELLVAEAPNNTLQIGTHFGCGHPQVFRVSTGGRISAIFAQIIATIIAIVIEEEMSACFLVDNVNLVLKLFSCNHIFKRLSETL